MRASASRSCSSSCGGWAPGTPKEELEALLTGPIRPGTRIALVRQFRGFPSGYDRRVLGERGYDAATALEFGSIEEASVVFERLFSVTQATYERTAQLQRA